MTRTFLEFFAGGGMARAGLGPGWRCAFANDIDPAKARAYAANWGDAGLRVGDVAAVDPGALPAARADLAWASFPCQDLSLAGAGAGLAGERSGAFLPFWLLIKRLGVTGRAPRLIVLENVCGLLSSHGGRDFAELCRMLAMERYGFGALVMDAADFVPQSRPRLFIVAFAPDVDGDALARPGPDPRWHPDRLRAAHAALRPDLRAAWRWFAPPPPPPRAGRLADLLEPDAADWHAPQHTARLLAMMTPLNRAKVDEALAAGGRAVGGVYRRTRPDGDGRRQRAEVRFDDVAGCLRTPGGGSSRQTILVVEDGSVRSRLLTARETARLMGLPDTYKLPERYNEAYHLTGDGVVVPVVRWLAAHLLEPLVDQPARPWAIAAE